MNELEKQAADCLKTIENQIYEPDRQAVIKKIVEIRKGAIVSKKIYDAMMNLSVEVGEIEVENMNLTDINSKLAVQINNTIQDAATLERKADKLSGELLRYEMATWKDRLRYFFTGKIGGGE